MAGSGSSALKAAYQTEWAQLQPYLKAYVGGKFSEETIDENENSRFLHDRNRLWWISGIVVTVIFAMTGLFFGPIPGFFILIPVDVLIANGTSILLAEIFGNELDSRALARIVPYILPTLVIVGSSWVLANFMVGRHRVKRVRARRYYLRNFRSLHARRGADFNWSAAFVWLWPAYRGMYVWAIALFGVSLGLFWYEGLLRIGGMPSWYRGVRIASVIGLSIALGWVATRLYFMHAMKAVAATLALPKAHALDELRKRGGSHRIVLWIAIIALVFAGSIAIDVSDVRRYQFRLRNYIERFGKPELPPEVRAVNAEMTGLLRLVERSGLMPDLRERHPEFYGDSPQYDFSKTAELMKRTREYRIDGTSPEQAMLAAIRQMEKNSAAGSP